MDAPDNTLSTSLGLVRWIGWAQRKAGDDWSERDIKPCERVANGHDEHRCANSDAAR